VHDIYVFEGLDGGDKLFDDESGLRFGEEATSLFEKGGERAAVGGFLDQIKVIPRLLTLQTLHHPSTLPRLHPHIQPFPYPISLPMPPKRKPLHKEPLPTITTLIIR